MTPTLVTERRIPVSQFNRLFSDAKETAKRHSAFPTFPENNFNRRSMNFTQVVPRSFARASGLFNTQGIIGTNFGETAARTSVEFRGKVKRKQDKRNKSVILTPTKSGIKSPEFSVTGDKSHMNVFESVNIVQGLPGSTARSFLFSKR